MKKLWKKILWIEGGGLAVIIGFIWLNEYLDLPHVLFKAPPTPFNFTEALFETGLMVVLGGSVILYTIALARRLQRSDREKDRLLEVIAHDLRSPFTTLLGNTELLQNPPEDLSEEDRATLISDIHQSAANTFQMLENLLNWARLRRQHAAPEPELIEARELIDEIIADLEDQWRDKEVTITNNLAKEARIFADPIELRSILRNLISNAIKFSRPQGSVEVTGRKRGGKTRIEVIDHGVGLTRREQKLLMSKHFAFSKPGTKGEKGSGIGLMLVRELTRRNGGKLKLRSAPDKGSVFTLQLPRTVRRAPKVEKKKKQKPESKPAVNSPEKE